MRSRMLLLMAVLGAALVSAPSAMASAVTPSHTGWLAASNADPSLNPGYGDSLSCTGSFCAAVGENGGVATSSDGGSTWSPIQKLTITESGGYTWSPGLISVSCASGPVCVAVGDGGYASVYQNGSWGPITQVDPGTTTNGTGPGVTLEDVSCPSSSFCVATDTDGSALVYTGSSWSSPVAVDPSQASFSSVDLRVSCASSSFCGAVDTKGDAFTYDGTKWTAASGNPVGPANGGFRAISCATDSSCMTITESGGTIGYTSGSWGSQIAQPVTNGSGTAPLYANSVSCSSASNCFAWSVTGGNQSEEYTYNGTSWTGTQYTFPARGSSISSVSCPSSSSCVATDYNGAVFTSAGGNWTQSALVGGGHIVGVSCGSSTTCMAVDANGRYLEYSAGSWGAPQNTADTTSVLDSVSCATATFCAVGDWNGDVTTFNGTSWTPPTPVDTNSSYGVALTSISCPTTSFCAAVDNQGRALTYDGTSWSTPTTIDSRTVTTGSYTSTVGVALYSVSCASASLCVAGDANGSEMTYHGSSWSTPQTLFSSSNNNISSVTVSCPDAQLCVAADPSGSWAKSSDGGTTWSTPAAIAPPQYTGAQSPGASGVSCTSDTFCQAALDDGQTAVFDGTKWSTMGPVSSGNTNIYSLGQIACVSDTSNTPFCAASDYSGDVLTWTPQKPYAETPPYVQAYGAPSVGQQLTLTQGVWDNAPSSVTDQWYDCPPSSDGSLVPIANCTAISQATGTTYTPQTSDEGKDLEVEETATNAYGSQTSDTSAGPVQAPAPSSANPPTVTGTPQVGQTLTESGDTWNPSPSTTNYQWFDCDSSGNNCTEVANDSYGQTYTVASSDVGHTLEVAVTACNNTGACSNPVSSKPTAGVTNPPSAGGGGGSGGSGGGAVGSGGSGGGSSSPTTPPPAPTGAVSSQSAASTSPGGTAKAADAGSTVVANGEGSFTLAQYGGNPISTPGATSPGAFGAGAGGAASFLDVHVAAGSSFSTLQLKDCNLAGGYTLFWWNGSAWLPATPQSYSPGPPACATATLSNTSSPRIDQLNGTVFAVAYTAKASTRTAHVKGTRVSVPVSCVGSSKAKCIITIALTATAKVKGGRVIALVAGAHMAKGKPKAKATSTTVMLGVVKVTLTGGQSKTVTVSLNRGGAYVLRARHRLSAELTVQQAGNMVSHALVSFKARTAKKR